LPLNVLHANDRQGIHPPSLYAATTSLPDAAPPLEGRVGADVCIIGAGYSGLSAALHLAQAGQKVVVLEAHRAGWGASGRNGGQAGSGQRRPQDQLEAIVGKANAHRLWRLAEEAKALVRGLIARHAIECEVAAGVIHADHKPRYVAHTRDYVKKLSDEYGYPHVRFLDRDEIRATVASDDFHGGMLDTDAFHLHPLRYCLGLAGAARQAGVTIFENSEAARISHGDPHVVRTDRGAVAARHVVVACNGYLGRLVPQVAASVMPINNFVIATEPLGQEAARGLIANNAAVADSRFVINYFRLSADHRLIFGGGESYGYRFPADIAALVRPRMLQVFPQLEAARIEFAWGGTLAITTRRLPAMMGLAPGLWSISGYSGHGVTIATLAGRLVAQAIAGDAEPFDFMAAQRQPAFPGGAALRWPILAAAMTWYSWRDRF